MFNLNRCLNVCLYVIFASGVACDEGDARDGADMLDAGMRADLGSDEGSEADLVDLQDLSADIEDQGAPDQGMSEGDMPQDMMDDQAADMAPEVVCPVAMARLQAAPERDAAAQLMVRPLETLALSASDAEGFVGVWRVVSRPVDSRSRLLPSPQAEAPTLWLDLAGRYELELEVTDPAGEARCPATRVLVDAVPRGEIYVELVWTTPADPDQADAIGADLDLHYLHPNAARWDKGPWDVFWNNREGDWGVLGNPDDNPALMVDDAAGLGPEVVEHDNPEADKVYRVGVYYYDTEGFGPSYATVRVYINGQLKAESRDVELETRGSFWEAAQISWPSGQVMLGRGVVQEFPSLTP